MWTLLNSHMNIWSVRNSSKKTPTLQPLFILKRPLVSKCKLINKSWRPQLEWNIWSSQNKIWNYPFMDAFECLSWIGFSCTILLKMSNEIWGKFFFLLNWWKRLPLPSVCFGSHAQRQCGIDWKSLEFTCCRYL